MKTRARENLEDRISITELTEMKELEGRSSYIVRGKVHLLGVHLGTARVGDYLCRLRWRIPYSPLHHLS